MPEQEKKQGRMKYCLAEAMKRCMKKISGREDHGKGDCRRMRYHKADILPELSG